MYLDTYERQNDWMVVRRAGLLFGSSPLHGFIVMYSTGIRAWGPYKYLLGFGNSTSYTPKRVYLAECIFSTYVCTIHINIKYMPLVGTPHTHARRRVFYLRSQRHYCG